MIEKDLKLMEGAGYIWRVTLKSEAGEVLRGDEYAVYGGFGAPWVSERSYAVVEDDGVWLVRMHGVYACNGGRYQLMACCKATGVEWMLATGCVEVERRVGHCGGCCIDAEAGVIECVLHHETLEAEVVLGDSTAACVDACVRVAAGVEEAKTAKDAAWRAVERAEGEAVKAAQARDGAARSAEDASNCAMTADERMADAEAAAERAKADADDAALALQAVRADAAKVEARAEDAAASAKAAAESASDAIEASAAASASEGEAARSAEEARVYDMRAYEYGQAAEVAKSAAESAAAAAAAAQAEAAAAQAEAEAQATRAEANADLLGDAALQGSNNTFAAGKTQTVNGIAVFNGATVFNGDCTGDAVDKQKAMAALRDLQGYKDCVYKYGWEGGNIINQQQAEIFSVTAKKDGEKMFSYYAKELDWRSTHAAMLLRYDKTSPVEILMGANRDCVANAAGRANNLYSRLWSGAGNSGGCFASLFIEGTHVYVKQSHSTMNGHYSFSVYDLGESAVLKNTNKLVWYLGDGFNNKIKMVIWGLVGNELQQVAVFNVGVVYSGGTKLCFCLWGKATNVYAVKDSTPELKNMLIAKNKEVTNKDFQLVNNDLPAPSIQTMEATGGELVVTFAEAAGCGWAVKRLPEWITAAEPECANGGQIVLTVAPNESGAARYDYMLFESVGNHAHGYPCTVCNEIKQNA